MTRSSLPSRSLVAAAMCALFCAAFLGACGHSSDSPYPAAIEEGRTAANEMLEQTGASSLSLTFVADGRIVWAETFGLADEESGTPPNAETMFGIGSVSKMLSTIAAMILVDRGDISLDEPIVTYIPSFRMLSPEYRQVTVRMLLNHSSGFPGSDLRNNFTSAPFPGYAQQLLETLEVERLKHPPGLMNTYCNDGFSMIENLIASVTGRGYVQFVQDEILTPLGMRHSRYALEAFPPGSFAHTYSGDDENPQAFVNLYATGGLYAAPSDMAKLILMLIGKGRLGSTRILSEDAIEAMAVDQTEGTFKPASSENVRFGLGWDTVSQPGLKAVGVRAWSKGGDTPTYGSALVVLPDVEMGVMVSGASNFGSGNAIVIAERILLRALVEKGIIGAFPRPIPEDPKPLRAPTPEEIASITGYFASNNSLLRFDANPDDSVTMLKYSGSAWKPYLEGLKMRDNGMFSTDDAPLVEFGAIVSDDRTYIVLRDANGYRHYQDDALFLQKIAPAAPLTAAWNSRLSKVWLLVNERADSLLPTNTEPGFSLSEPDGLPGLIAAGAYGGTLAIVDPSQSDDLGAMMLFMPQGGRDLNDVFIVSRNGEEWIRWGSFLYRPQEGVPELSAAGDTVVIGNEGWAEWRAVVSDGAAKTVTVTNGGSWKLFDPQLKWISTRQSSGSLLLPAAPGKYYLMFYGSPAESIAVTVEQS